MNTKKNRKIITDTPTLANNNNKKKSKNIPTQAENNVDKSSTNKKQKKENINVPQTESKTEADKVGRKRKHSDGDVESPTLKKKRGRPPTNFNSRGAVNGQVNSEATESNPNNSKKTKKRNKNYRTDESPYLTTSDYDNNSKPSEFGTSKSKKEAPLQMSFNTLGDSIVEVKEAPFKNNPSVVHMDLKDFQNFDSDSNEKDIFKELNNKNEEKMGNPEAPKTKAQIKWPNKDLQTLVDRMEASIPDHDTLAFNKRAEQLEWGSIAFQAYTAEDCKKMWFSVQREIRKFRLLKEVLADAKEWINTPNSKKNFKHPDMPRKPLSAYIIFFLEKKDEFHKAHPGLDATEITKMLGHEFKHLSPEKKQKYETIAEKKRGEYQVKLEEFYQTHPDVPRIVRSPRVRPEKPPKPPKPVKEKPPPKPQKEQKSPKEKLPKRPLAPFQYYYLSELEKNGKADDKLAFKVLCKERWMQMPDKKKVIWLNHAEVEYAKYETELSEYVQNHPEYVQNTQFRRVLSKKEVQIKDRAAGKPIKPPNSAYSLFARMLLQSNEIKDIPVKHRLNHVSNQWKNCEEAEKKQYKDLSLKLNEKYKLDFASYLETLPEDVRLKEMEKNLPKRRKPESEPEKQTETKKKKSERKNVQQKIVEPEQPPITAYKYFATLYTGEDPVAKAWRALSAEQKKIYEDELVKKKQAYIVDFEKFLKSLTKEELEAFSKSRTKIKKDSGKDDDDEESSDSEDSDDSEAESEDEDVSDN